MTSISRAGAQPDHGRVHARRAMPMSPPPTCATAWRACARSCRDEVDEPVIAKVEADAQPIIWLRLLARPAHRRSRSPTTPTASSPTGCRTCPAWPTCASSASGATRCASGSTALRLAAYGLTPQDVEDGAAPAEHRDAGRPHREPPARIHGAVRDRPAHARAVRRPDHPRRRRLSRCGCATSARAELGAARRARRSRASTASRRWRSASSSSRPPTRSTSRKAVQGRTAAASSTTLPDGHEDRDGASTPRCSSSARSTPCSAPSARRWCWWCW